MLTRQQHKHAIGKLAKEIKRILHLMIDKEYYNVEMELEVWKDYFWGEIFFHYLFNYDLLNKSNFDQHKNYGEDYTFADEDVSENIWDAIIKVVEDIIFDIRHYDYTTCINACDKMFKMTFEHYLKQFAQRNAFIVLEVVEC